MRKEQDKHQVTDDVDPIVPIDVIRPPSLRDHSDGVSMVAPSEPEGIVDAEIEDFEENRRKSEVPDEG